MKLISTLVTVLTSVAILGQNHSKKPIRFIFETVHDHMGNIDINSKRVKLFSLDHKLLYEADLYDGKELDEQFFYYRTDGKLLRDHRIFHQPHESGDFRMTYDAKGNLTEESNVDDRGRILEKKSMSYDAKGQKLTEKTEFLHATEGTTIVESSFEFTYGSNGKIAAKKGFEDEKPAIVVTYKYGYDATSETIAKHNANDELSEKWISKYDEKKRLISSVHTVYEKGMAPVSKTTDITYDQFDHVLTETLSASNSQIKKQIVFEYVYDANGNWTERKERKIIGAKESEGVFLKRTIEYYEAVKYNHPPMELDENYSWEVESGVDVKIFEETHVRINNNAGDLEWVVRRNGQSLFQVDEYEYKDGKLDRINHLNHADAENAYTLAKYNDKGLLIEIGSFAADGTTDEKSIYSYDDKGVLIKLEEHLKPSPTEAIQLAIVEEYKHDASGKVIRLNLTEYGSKYAVEYNYNESGELMKELQTPESNDEKVIVTVYYRQGGKLVSTTVSEGNAPTPSGEMKYEYDSRGELLKSSYHQHGKIKSETAYVYFE